ncbi:hypothetical protein [Actinomadura oligospora]|uniref:hypothetical protein n=1 Tax=Actinomadura oligospora TaxID=111804 RepID=UPI00047E9D92|nr:hypothetical protein [Actinomadura oligospora]
MSGETSHQEHIGPYRLLSRLDGPSGAVHRAADATGRDVAIRMLPPGAVPDVPRMRAVLSPYVVDVLDGDPEARPPYVVSRFVPGRPLAETVAVDGPLRGPALRYMAVALAKAVAAIHRAGLGHGSLDPRSVLVVDGAPVVVDFGLVADPEGQAGDIRAWSEIVLFAATGSEDASLDAPGLPGALRGLLRAAAALDLSARPNAEELIAAASKLDLGPAPEVPAPAAEAPAPYPDAPATGGFPAVMSGTGGFAMPPVHDTGGFAMPGPVGTGGYPEPTSGVATAVASHAHEDDMDDMVVGGRHAGSVADHELAVVRGWARLLAVLVIVIAGCVAVMMPVVGVTVSALAVTLLRITRARGTLGRIEAVGRTILSLPYAAVFAVGVPLMVVGVAAVGVELSTLGAGALGAGTGTIALWTAPGAGGARRALESAFEPLAWRPGTVAAAGLVLGVLTLAGLVAAMSFTPSFAPLYGLQSSLEATLSRFQNSLH